MNGVVARRNNFNEPILPIARTGLCRIRPAHRPALRLHHGIQDRGRRHGVRLARLRRGQHRGGVRLPARTAQRARSARSTSTSSARSPRRPSSTRCAARRTSSSSSAPTKAWPATIRSPATSASRSARRNEVTKFGGALPALTPEETPRLFRGAYGIGSRDFRPEHTLGAYEFAIGQTARKDGKSAADGETLFRPRRRSSLRGHQQGHAVAAARKADRGAFPLHRRLGHDHDRQESRLDHRRFRPVHLRAESATTTRTASSSRSSSSWRIRNTARRKRARPPIIISPSRPSRSR